MRFFAASILCFSALAQTPDDKCSVEGIVINSVTREPVKKARVILASTGKTNNYASTTDEAGHFLIDQVDAGRFSLSASASGYTQSISRHGMTKPNAALTLEKGQKMKEVVVKLAPEGVISGRILDADGDPLEGVNVESLSIEYERGKRQLIVKHHSSTNELGEFRMPYMAPGKYILCATYLHFDEVLAVERPTSPPGVPAAKERYVATYYPSAMNPNNASPIAVTPGAQISGVTITLLRTRTFSIKGHVSSDRGAQTQVVLWQSGELRLQAPMGAEVDAKGRFQLDGVAPGSYVLFAGGEHAAARMPLEVHDENIDGIDLSLQPHGEIQVRATVEEGEAKYAPRQFSIASRTSGQWGECQPQDDSPCKFLDLDREGPYDVLPIGLPVDLYVKSARLGDQDVLDSGFEFTPGVTGTLTLVLSPNSGQIEGSATNAKEEPAADVKITLIPDDAHRSPMRYKITNTDQNGHFILKGVAPGDYKIYAWEDIEDGAEQYPDFMKPHESEGQTVSVKERAHETVQLKAIPAAEKTGQ